MLRQLHKTSHYKARLTRLHAYYCNDKCSYDRTIKYIEKYIELLSMKDTTTTVETAADLHKKIGLVYFNETENYHLALKHFQKSLELHQLNDTTYNGEKSASLNQLIGACYGRLCDHKTSLMYYKQALLLYEQYSPTISDRHSMFKCLAILYHENDQFETSIEYYLKYFKLNIKDV
ncbi:unnamed protein product [Didymodactylos carnosus]|uniref:Uncharacterized protein n=1 Tax=Didymodactylos carnosus TaxID=1234261 RepID=A0A814RCE6_9BILA|nr:unnamed protein product [Didymodactylos carnosus]CAF3894001.1 unnamed protein product [Didymodactylos carnosus]